MVCSDGGAPKGSGCDLAGAGAMGVDEHIGGRPIAQGAGLAGGFLASLNARGTMSHPLRCGRTLGSHQEATPAGVTGCHVVRKAVTGCLADPTETLRPWLAPLVGIARVAVAEFQNARPDLSRDHGRVTRSTEPDGPARENVPVVPYGRIAAPVVGIPDGERRLKPFHIAGSLVIASVWTVAADTGAPAILEAVVWLDIPGEDPRLKHGPGLAVGRSLAETGHDANDGRAIEGGDALPQNAAVRIDGHDET